MSFDQQPLDDREFIQMWKETPLPGSVDAGQLARMIGARIDKFDRKIFWRNLREYVAGGVLIVYFLWLCLNPHTRFLASAGLLAVGFVMVYMWRSQRRKADIDPSADVASYHRALLGRYDEQIALLRKVRYWYVLPLYLWMLLVMITVTPRVPGGRLAVFIVITGSALFVVWLNEGYAVRKLRSAREKAERLLEKEQ